MKTSLHRRARILSGVQASGPLHVGNYYGALRQLQNDGEPLYFIANLHALSTVRDAHALREHTLEAALAYLSLGLDPHKAILFRQSDIPEITGLFWILGSLVPISNLERAHSYKDKAARGVPANFGLFAYPVLMAAEIIAFGAGRPVAGTNNSGWKAARRRAAKRYVEEFGRACPRGFRFSGPAKAPRWIFYPDQLTGYQALSSLQWTIDRQRSTPSSRSRPDGLAMRKLPSHIR